MLPQLQTAAEPRERLTTRYPRYPVLRDSDPRPRVPVQHACAPLSASAHSFFHAAIFSTAHLDMGST
jgi:hypothetical protein